MFSVSISEEQYGMIVGCIDVAARQLAQQAQQAGLAGVEQAAQKGMALLALAHHFAKAKEAAAAPAAAPPAA